MGRHKTRNKHLPPRMRLIKGRFYWIGHVDGRRPCEPLGADFVTALIKWRDIEGLNESTGTVASMLDHFLAKCDTKSEATMREYVRLVAKLKRSFEGFGMADVEPHHVARVLSTPKSKFAGNRMASVLSGAFNRARKDGLFTGPNPCAGIERNEEKKRTRKATLEEQRALSGGSGIMAVGCELALLTGLRQSDIRLMRLDQITEDGLLVQPRKTKESTGATLLFEWTPALRACIAKAKLIRRRVGSVYLLPNRNGKPCTGNGWRSLWFKYRKSRGVAQDLQFKDLRRTALATVKNAHGIDRAKEFAAHGSVTTTESYLTGLDAVRVRPTR